MILFVRSLTEVKRRNDREMINFQEGRDKVAFLFRSTLSGEERRI